MTRLEQDRAAALEASRVSQAEAKRENAAHTAGPWGTYVNKWPDEVVIRSMFPDGSERAQVAITNASNARLIAAAPDLLEALQSVWLWAENQSDAQSKGGHETFDLLMLREQRDIARAAIARATGEQP